MQDNTREYKRFGYKILQEVRIQDNTRGQDTR